MSGELDENGLEATIRRLRDYAKDAEAKKWWLRFCEAQQALNAAETQVLRLTEENEALRKERDEARNEAWALADQVNEWGAWAEGLTPVEISNGMAKREARIKALEEVSDARVEAALSAWFANTHRGWPAAMRAALSVKPQSDGDHHEQ